MAPDEPVDELADEPADEPADELLDWLRAAQALGFVGPGDVRAHVAHADAFVRAVDGGGSTAPGGFAGRALDLGTGAGIPGLVLALRWPRSQWVLLDARQRRIDPLAGAVERLGLASRVRVAWARAELAGHDPELREAFDLVVARSFAAPGVTAECGAPFLAVGGQLAVSEPPAATEATTEAAPEATTEAPVVRWPPGPLAGLGLAPVPSSTSQVQLLAKVAPTAADRPRRVGIPAKRPLF